MLETEQKRYQDQIIPARAGKKQDARRSPSNARRTSTSHALSSLERAKPVSAAQLTLLVEKEKTDKTALETRFRNERAQWKASISALSSQHRRRGRGRAKMFSMNDPARSRI